MLSRRSTQSVTVVGTESSFTPLTNANGVPLTPLPVAYFHISRIFHAVSWVSSDPYVASISASLRPSSSATYLDHHGMKSSCEVSVIERTVGCILNEKSLYWSM